MTTVNGPDEIPRQYVYRIFDRDGALLYIGCTQYPERRIAEHRKRSAWSEQIDTVRLEGPFTYYEGFAVERAAIEAEAPRHNVRWNGVAA